MVKGNEWIENKKERERERWMNKEEVKEDGENRRDNEENSKWEGN